MGDLLGGTLTHFCPIPLKVFTGAAPFSDSPGTAAVVQIVRAERPPRPTHPILTEDLWILMQRCWNHDPKLRPNASEVFVNVIYGVSLCAFSCGRWFVSAQTAYIAN